MQFFLSYPDIDEDIAESIAHGLSALGHNVWVKYDRITSDIAKSLVGSIKIQEGIESADVFLALLTPNGKPSEQHILYAQHRKLPIIPISLFTENEDLEWISRGDWVETPFSLNSYDKMYIRSHMIADDLKELVKKAEEIVSAERTSITQTDLEMSRKLILEKDVSKARIFIAYSRKQSVLAKAINDFLLGNGKAVFWDAKIRAGASWRQMIHKALDESTHLIVIWTPDAAQSDEVDREVSYALSEGKVIIPILSKEIPKLPYHLHGLHYIILEEDLSKIGDDLLKAIDQQRADEDIWQ